MRHRVTLTFLAVVLTLAACKRRETYSTSTAPSPCAPKIAKHPMDTTVSHGQGTVLTVTVEGEGPFTYKWYEIGPTGGSVAIPGSVSKVTVIPQKTTGYFVWVYNRCGGTESNLATVTVQ